MAESVIPKSLASDIQNVISKLGTNFRVLNIESSQGTSFNTVLQDIVANCGTLSDYTVFVGIHKVNGRRAFIGYVYPDKLYAACIYFEYSGICRLQYLNNGTYSSKDL